MQRLGNGVGESPESPFAEGGRRKGRGAWKAPTVAAARLPHSRTMNKLPLDGIRVIDLSQVYAGPLAARQLADMGAEVIRVESPLRSGRGGLEPQPGTSYPNGDAGKRPFNRSAYYNELHRNKLAISLDLSGQRGRDVFKRLVKVSDVLIENFSPRVMANFELDYPVLQEINPGIIMVSISAYGQTGPWRDCVSFGRGIEAMAGLSQLTAYPNGQPIGPGIAYADATAGLHAAFAVLLALRQRTQTGVGQHIDLALRESLTMLLGAEVIGQAMNRRPPTPQGNGADSPIMQGCYRCRGEDAWIAITIESEDEWQRFRRAIGNPDWIREKRCGTLCEARQNRTELDPLIEAWTLHFEPEQAMTILQNADIRAGAVLDAKQVYENPHLRERGFFHSATHPEAGTHDHPGMPWRIGQTPLPIRMPAPCFAQDNEYVFGKLLGMAADEIQDLVDSGVTPQAPSR